jgi:ribosomal protein S18 acetylase RimI-like enzyme
MPGTSGFVMLDLCSGGFDMTLARPHPDPDAALTESPLGIARAGTPELPAISRTLALAFEDDPVFEWVIPDARRRRQITPSFFLLVASALEHHRATYQAGNAIGAALWVPAGQPPISPDEEEKFGERLGAMFGPDMDRLGALTEVMEEQHPHEPHEYLWFLGVHPAWQGHGIGAALLNAVLERLDDEGSAAYLEATSPDNVRLYHRHGFEINGVINAHGGAPLWQMWREPLRTRPRA